MSADDREDALKGLAKFKRATAAFKRATAERDVDVVTAYLLGVDVSDIAERAGMTRKGVRMVLDRMGVERPRKP